MKASWNKEPCAVHACAAEGLRGEGRRPARNAAPRPELLTPLGISRAAAVADPKLVIGQVEVL